MARKFVSGVLAFAMVFGATAPVVFAEPVATEVVDQEASYLPSFEKSEVTVKKGETVIVKVNDIGDDVKEVRLVKAGDNAQNDDGVTSTFYDVQYIASSKSIMITNKDDKADKDTTFKFKLIPVDSKFKNDYSTEYISLKLANPKPTAKTLTGWENTTVTVGKSASMTLKYNDGSVPSNVSVALTTVGQQYVSVETADVYENGVKTGVKVTFTGLKTPSDDDAGKIKATLKADGETVGEITLTVKAATSATAMTLKASAEKVNVNDAATLVAQAYVTNDYGNMTTDEAPYKVNLVWSINGVVTDKLTDNKGNELATLTPVTDKHGIVSFKAKVPGTYKVTVSDDAGTQSATREITVLSTAAPVKAYVAKSTTNLAEADTDTTVKPGATVDMGALTYAAYTAGDGSTTNPYANPALMSAFSGWTVSYAPAASVKNLVSSYDKTTGKITIVDENDADLIAAMSNEKKTAEVPVVVTFKKGTTELKVNYTIKVSKAGATAVSLVVTDEAGKKTAEATYDEKAAAGKQYTEGVGSIVTTVGKTVKFTAKVADDKGFTDAIAQDMIWTIANVDKTDKTEYATVDANGVVTAKVASIGAAELVGVSTADPNLKVKITLYIKASTETPAPTATAEPTVTPAPTATAEPTKAPETKTGKVTASSLRVRETPVNGTVIGKLAKGTAVTILETKDGWYKVTKDSLTGWVSGEYVELTTPSTTETAKTTANLKLRKTAKTGSVITTMPKGSKVEVLEKGSEWSKVKYNGKTGYASNAYLEFEEDAVG